MKKKDFDAINDALVRIGINPPKDITDKEDLVRRGTIMGFMIWLKEYYENNKEEER